MHDSNDVPRVPPPSVFALFSDAPAARVALETMLQGGFHSEQLGWVKAHDSILSPANDLSTYRATGLPDSSSSQDQSFAAEDSVGPAQRERDLAMLREHAIVVSVAPHEGQEGQARELLAALGGRLLREDGSLEEQAA